MALEITNRQPTNAFEPVPVAVLLPGCVPRIDLYYQLQNHPIPVLYRSRSLPFTKRESQELARHQITRLWIHKQDVPIFEQYIQHYFSNIVQDQNVPLETKCSMSYGLTTQMMRRLFESEDPSRVIVEAGKIVTGIIEVIFSDPRAAHQFITIAAQDYELYTHSVNVCLYGLALAKKVLGLSNQEALTKIGPALLLHDIGKLRISRDILTKTKPLTLEEWDEIKMHPIYGVDMVKEIMNLTPEIESVILQHHERLDGSGYPYGLQRREISTYAKIAALVNRFDSLTTHRVFRKRVSSYEAFQIIQCEVPDRYDEIFFREFVYLFLPPEEYSP